jgi:TonB-linked SusC/RagA family outer membrane protein
MKKTDCIPFQVGFKKILRIMRITAVLVFILSMQLSAKSFGQTEKVNLSMNSTIKDVIERIEEVSGYRFVLKYNESILDKKVDVKYTNESIERVLDDLLKDTGFTYNIVDRYIAIRPVNGSAVIDQQQKSVTGKVIDSAGAPVPGVSVVVAGTTNGTITDFDGGFTISNLPANATLQFSFVGMKSQEVQVGNKTTINVTMAEESIGLDEVIAVGYGTQKKADLTGAISVVKMESLKSVSLSSGNSMQALQGRVPGLYIEKTGSPTGAPSRILIRGVNTLGDPNPLYIIDGVPTKRPEVFQSLNPGSIESVQVLKDASASSIYGARASNGVIIVTTNNGSKKNGEISIQYNSNVSIQSEKNQRFKMVNAEDRGKILWQASVNDRVNPADGYGAIYGFDWNNDFNNPVLNKVTVKPFVGGDPNVPVGDTDWQAEAYKTGYVTNNDITISGGNDKTSALLGMGYIKNTGMMKYTNYDRISARLNAQTSVFQGKIKVGMNTEMVSSNETLQCPDLGSAPTPGLAINLAPTIPMYTLTGEYAGPIGSGYSDRNNPVHMQYLNRWDNTNRTFFFGNVFTEIAPMKNLVFRSTLGIDYSMVNNKNIEQRFTEGFIARAVNSLRNINSNFTSISWSNTLNYRIDLGQSKFAVLAGIESVGDNFKDVTAYKEGFAVQTEEFFVLSAGTANGNSFGTAQSSRLFSQFGKVEYTFSDKYLATATLRRDGSSRFGANNRYGLFPAATLGWRISAEPFMSSIPQISNLKLRAGAGKVGNQDVGSFASLGLFEPRYGATAFEGAGIPHIGFFDQYRNVGTAYDITGGNSGNLPSGFVSVQAANPSLRWESTKEFNIGLDFGIFNNKLIGAFDYFTRETSDILIRPPVASAVGEGQLQFLNGATKTNKGWELSLSYAGGKRDADFTYNISASAGHFKDKITVLPEEVRTGYPGNAEQSIIGHSELSVFGYVTDGLFQNAAEVAAHASQPGAAPGRIRYKDLNGDKKVDALDQKFLGTLLPALEYSLRIELNYKNFDLAIFGSGVAGKTGYCPYIQMNNFVRGRDNAAPGLFNAWSPTNTGSSIPALTLSDNNAEFRTSDYFMINASYFKLRNISLGYKVPASVLKKIGVIKELRVYGMADNVFWITSKEWQGPDPERTDVNTIPIPRTISFGVNVSF